MQVLHVNKISFKKSFLCNVFLFLIKLTNLSWLRRTLYVSKPVVESALIAELKEKAQNFALRNQKNTHVSVSRDVLEMNREDNDDQMDTILWKGWPADWTIGDLLSPDAAFPDAEIIDEIWKGLSK